VVEEGRIGEVEGAVPAEGAEAELLSAVAVEGAFYLAEEGEVCVRCCHSVVVAAEAVPSVRGVLPWQRLYSS